MRILSNFANSALNIYCSAGDAQWIADKYGQTRDIADQV